MMDHASLRSTAPPRPLKAPTGTALVCANWQIEVVVIVCDGTEAAARRIERVPWSDPASGVMRHADADEAIACARAQGLNLPMAAR